MIIRHSLSLLEQLSDIELKIQRIEKMMEKMGIVGDQEKLIKQLLSKRNQLPSEQQNKNLLK